MTDLTRKIKEMIEPSIYPQMNLRYYPASAILNDGKVLDWVYFVNRERFLEVWGDSSGRDFVDISEVKDIKKSPYRLPARFANQIYQRGETNMGGIMFTIEMKDYRGFYYAGGGAIDFIDLPDGYTMDDIINVNSMHDYALREKGYRMVKPYVWCLIDDPSFSL